MRLLRPDGVGLTVVGDDAQAVYGFRGADSRHLLELSADLRRPRRSCAGAELPVPATDPRPGQRDPPGRRRTASCSCARTATAVPRPRLVRCHDASAEARLVVDAVLDAAEQGRPLSDQAVLMRAAHHSDLLEVELTARRRPVRQVRRPEVPGGRARQRLHRRGAAAGQPARRDRLVPAAAPARRHRPGPSPRAARRAATRRARHRLRARRGGRRRAAPSPHRARRHPRPAGRGPPAADRGGAGRARPGPVAAVAAPRATPTTRPGWRPRPARRRRRPSSRRWPTTSPTSPSTRRPRPATSPGRRTWTRTTWCCPLCTRPRAWSGTACTSSTSSTARSRPTWPCPSADRAGGGAAAVLRRRHPGPRRAAPSTRRCACRTTGGPATTSTAIAAASRFLDDAAQQTLSVTDLTPARAAPVSPRPAPTRVELPALDELWA